MDRSVSLVAVGFALWSLVCSAPCAAQPGPEVSSLDVAQVTSQLGALQARTDLDEAQRKRGVDAYTQALDLLRRARDQRSRAQELERRVVEAPKELEQTRARLKALPQAAAPVAAPDVSLAELEGKLLAARQSLSAARDRAGQLRRDAEQRVERRRALSAQLTELRKRLGSTQAAAEVPEPPGEPERAEHTLARAQLALLQAEIAAVEGELASDEARGELVAAQRDLAQRELALAEAQPRGWEEEVARRRRDEAAAQAQRARALQREAARASPELREAADQARRLAEYRLGPLGLNARTERVQGQLRQRQRELRELREQYKRLRRRFDTGFPQEVMGGLLRQQLERLPAGVEADQRSLSERMATIQAALLDLEDLRSTVGDVGTLLAELRKQSNEPEAQAVLEEVGREVLESRREVLDAVIAEHQRLLDQQTELTQTLATLGKATEELRRFLEERILWIPSVTEERVPSRAALVGALEWLQPGPFLSEGRRVLRGISVEWILALSLLALLIVPALYVKLRAGESDVEGTLGPRAWQHAVERVAPWLVLCAIAVVVGQLLLSDLAPRARGLGAAARALGLYGGLLALGWGLSNSTGGPSLRRLILGCGLPFLVASAVVAALEYGPEPSWANALGRLAFLVAMVCESLLLGLAFRATGPLGAPLRAQSGLVGRLAPGVTLVAVGVPLVMGALAAIGYYYTALRLELRFEGTLALVLAALFAYDLLLAALTATTASQIPAAAEAIAKEQQVVPPPATAAGAVSEAATSEAEPEGATTESEVATTEPAVATTEPESATTEPEVATPEGPKTEPEGPKTEAEGPKTEAEGPKTEAEGPKTESDVATPEGPKSETEGPKLEGESATTEAAKTESARQQSPAATSDFSGSDSSTELRFPLDGPALQPPQALPPALFDHQTTTPPEQDPEALRVLLNQARDTVWVVVALLLLVGLGALWADVLPALGRLNDVRLYPSLEVVDHVKQVRYPTLEEAAPATATSPERAPAPAPPAPTIGLPKAPALPTGEAEASEPLVVTLADLGLAILLTLVTIALSRSLPGALEFALLPRLPLDAGGRYAASTVVRYLILFVGLSAALQAVGVSWERIQWLAAALTFGLAFGLQEIFANFISGLIILFERPVRVGDIVTLGDVTGRVTRVHMRATTVVNWDRKELIIPNKEFVTGRVINWTLTESVTRVVIPVGIAYGSDVEAARSLILNVALAHPDVLSDPEPSCYFERFADSSYELTLRLFLPRPALILKTRHEVLEGIRHGLGDANIEIAFPQRDLHIRSADVPLRVETSEKPRSRR